MCQLTGRVGRGVETRVLWNDRSVADPRVEQYARLIVERSLDVQPGWQVLVRSTPLARPLLEEVTRLIAQRGAYPLLRLGFSSLWPVDGVFPGEATEETLGGPPS